MRVPAKVDYAVRAAVELAAAQSSPNPPGPVKAETIARAQGIPLKFLENILQGLRQASLIESWRGPDGGHTLARPASEIADRRQSDRRAACGDRRPAPGGA